MQRRLVADGHALLLQAVHAPPQVLQKLVLLCFFVLFCLFFLGGDGRAWCMSMRGALVAQDASAWCVPDGDI